MRLSTWSPTKRDYPDGTPKLPTPQHSEPNVPAAELRLARALKTIARVKRASYLFALVFLVAGAALLVIHSDDTPFFAVTIAVGAVLFAIGREAIRARDRRTVQRTQQALAKHAERLNLLHEIDHAVANKQPPEAIAGAAIQPLRELLGVNRAIVNLFDLAAGQVEWLAAAGRRRTHVGRGVMYSIRLMGDIETLKRGEPQIIDTTSLPPGPEVDALLASDVRTYMVVPMLAGGELIGALSFGGPHDEFPSDQVSIAKEVATQFAIAITQARLYEQIRRHADELEDKVRARTEELRAAHAESLQLTAQLQAANKELEAFSYSVSHDLRAPLRSLAGFSQALSEDYADKLDDEGRDYLRRIRAAAQRMGQLIDDMLQLAQVSRAEMRRASLNLSDIAHAVVEELRHGDPERNVDVHIEENVTAEADSRLVRALLDNLIGNAWKFTSKTAAARIAFGAKREGDALVYFVRDNGAGFDMTYGEKLFRPFQRLHTEAEFPGTGIGLATVSRIVARHGGRVWAEGAADSGATFFFTLP